MFYSPPATHRERLGQELTVTFLNDVILEYASCEGMQAMLNSGALKTFNINDEEILVRHFHKTAADYVQTGESAR